MPKSTQVLEDYTHFKTSRASSVCLGNFDGLHLGHQNIFKTCLDNAKRRNFDSVVFTFEPHPRKIIRPNGAPSRLLSRELKRDLLCQLSFDVLIEQNFNSEFMNVSAEDFVERVLIQALRVSVVIVGPDFRFGYGGKGDARFLEKYSDKFETIKIDPIHLENLKISSTRIREDIFNGKIESANACLGRPVCLEGRIVPGDGRGLRIGFPTANLKSSSEVLPSAGVYATISEDLMSHRYFVSVTNCGVRPTFEKNEFQIESHWIHFADDLYGRDIRLYFFKKLRDEIRFPSVEKLCHQIFSDIAEARQFFHGLQLFHASNAEPVASLTQPHPPTQGFQPLGSLEELLRA